MTEVQQPSYGPEEYALLPEILKRQVLDMMEFQSKGEKEAEEKAQREDRIEAQRRFAYEQEEGRRRARMQRDQEQLDGTVTPEAELFREARLKARIREAHDFTPKVKEPIVQGLFFRDSLTWVAGPSGTFKSFVTADLAFRYGQEDMDFHGMRMTSGRSLIIVAEGAGGYADRKTAWEKEHGREVKNVSIYPAPLQLGDDLREMPALISYLKEEKEAGRPFGLIIFDTQAMCTVGMDENTSEMNRVINMLHQIREVSDACVLTVHHFGKDKRAGMRGSSMIYAAADTVCVLKRKDDAMDVQLSTAQADDGKQKDGEALSDFLTLELKRHPVGEDYFGDPTFSLVPVAVDGGSHDVHDEPGELPTELPWLTEPQMDHLKLASFYEHRGATPADMAAKQAETTGPVKNQRQNIRNRMVELAKMNPPLVEQRVAKGPWYITPAGVAVIAQQVAVGEHWVERAGRRRQVSREVSGGQRNLLGETPESSAKPEAKPAPTSSET